MPNVKRMYKRHLAIYEAWRGVLGPAMHPQRRKKLEEDGAILEHDPIKGLVRKYGRDKFLSDTAILRANKLFCSEEKANEYFQQLKARALPAVAAYGRGTTPIKSEFDAAAIPSADVRVAVLLRASREAREENGPCERRFGAADRHTASPVVPVREPDAPPSEDTARRDGIYADPPGGSLLSVRAHALPDVLAQHRWDCAEAVDLVRWVSVLRERDDFPPVAIPSSLAVSPRERHEAATALLSSMASLRHAAVDRHRLTINEVEQYIGQATGFLRLLGATSCLERLTPLQETVSIAVHHLGEGRNASTTTMNEVAAYTAGRRAELEALERATRD
ncbi:hypothetical protein PCL_02511 [Purpureocillium lilacinum]|uniref:Uncharacterized protein n=2 Tax=Purpureocillium lilacinum TaxID=33203 RepID=A0ACC4E894_PURLI|nr:hypothetical protein PCL_02511 [Purpureocillium lilacinum]